jgi:hypothetical protein
MAPGKRRRSRARSISAPAKEAQKDPFAAVEKSRRESQAPRQRTPEPEPEPDDDDDVAVDAVSGATGVTDAVMLNVRRAAPPPRRARDPRAPSRRSAPWPRST